jgi:hypothetical protein
MVYKWIWFGFGEKPTINTPTCNCYWEGAGTIWCQNWPPDQIQLVVKKKCLEPIRNMGSCFFTKTIIWICIYYFLLKIFAVFMWGLHGVLNSVYSNCFLGLNISILTIINKKMAQCWVCFLSLPQEC